VKKSAVASCILSLLIGVTSGCGGYQANNSTVDSSLRGQAGDGTATPSGSGSSSAYRWQSLYRGDIRTVAVPIFSSKSFQRGVEFNLTKAVVQQMEARTPYKVVSRENADTVLEGEIEGVRVENISSNDRTTTPQEQLLTVRVNFVWKELKTGRILCERRGFEQSSAYYPSLGEGRFAGTEIAIERLAVGIVHELESDW
jgi:Lipopolysaccharide-assembly